MEEVWNSRRRIAEEEGCANPKEEERRRTKQKRGEEDRSEQKRECVPVGRRGRPQREENVHTVRGVKVVAAYRDDAAVADHPAHHPLGALAAVATQF